MNADDKKRFGNLIAEVMAFYKQEISTFALNVWWQACEGYSFEQCSKAITAHAMDAEKGVFPPKPADIVRQLSGTATDRALMAWGKVFDAMGRVGAYTDVVFDDAVIHAVVTDLGGWVKICRSELAELSYLQHRFTESYRTYAQRGIGDYPRRLVGDRSSDDTYMMRGLPPPKPAVVGDVVQARLVYQRGQLQARIGASMQALEAIERGPRLIGGGQSAAAA